MACHGPLEHHRQPQITLDRVGKEAPIQHVVGERFDLPLERAAVVGYRQALLVPGHGVGQCQGAAGRLPHRVERKNARSNADHFERSAWVRLGAVVADVQTRERAADGFSHNTCLPAAATAEATAACESFGVAT